MLWLCYALLKKDAFFLTTINSFGCAIESIYIFLYFFYAPMPAKVFHTFIILPVFFTFLFYFMNWANFFFFFYELYGKLQKQTLQIVLSLNIGVFSVIVVLIQTLLKGTDRIHVFGGICASFSVAVFAAPLSIVVSLCTQTNPHTSRE